LSSPPGAVNGLTWTVTKVSTPGSNTFSTPHCGDAGIHCILVESAGNGPRSIGFPSGLQAKVQAVFNNRLPVFQWGAFGMGDVTMSGSTAVPSYDPSKGCGTPPCPYSDSGPSKNTLASTPHLVGADVNISNLSNKTPPDGIFGDAQAGGTYNGTTTPCTG